MKGTVLSSLGVLVLLVGGLSGSGGSSPGGLIRPYSAPGFGGCGDCLACIPPDPPSGHVWWGWGWGPTWGENHIQCYLGFCDHPACMGGLGVNDSPLSNPFTGEERLVLAAEQAVLQGGPAAPRAAIELLTRYPDRVTLNRDRSALQILSTCSRDRIAAHIPLSKGVMAAIEAGVVVSD